MRRISVAGFVLAIAAFSSGGVALAQPEASPSAVPSVDAAISASPVPAEMDTAFALEEPRWKKITPEHGPAAREDHTWTVDGDGRYAYLFGGRDRGEEFSDLWRYDLQDDSWKRLSPSGKKPDPRFGHNAVWVDGFGVVIFAGQQGTDFFGDLWAYDPDADRWRQLPANGAAPKRRYGSCMIVGPDGRLWISHGFTFSGRFDDTRAYNLKTKRWASIAPDGRRPGERCLHDCFRSAAGELVLYGGQDNADFALGDLWVTRKNGTWRREDDPRAQDRRLYAVTEAGPYAYVFGGAGADNANLDDLWRVDRESLGCERVRVEGAAPAARYGAALITDAARGRLLVFGGQGTAAKSDVWELTDRARVEDEEAAPADAAPADTAPADTAPADTAPADTALDSPAPSASLDPEGWSTAL
jgi:N-acetylneuraminic acid mutarotase